ncbi:MAG: site-specific integrase [Candidatus Acididesulfobacter diazotrophicus]|jgi:integrase|uniref:Site-specific integrase n=1 Tax=Candidatus Acididesulfobacter diazotrophicus TaxID=2597226 RepID=A0A519BQP5_9DELT|nr:MAG: site-specific integrase [Candidatus Acididesulfobacter diazotrophicus]
MRIYKRGNIFWCEFRIDSKHYQFSCRTKDKTVAQEVASAIHADLIRNKFNIPAKYQTERLFSDIFQEYINNIPNMPNTIARKIVASKHFLQVFGNKNISDITANDIKTYQLTRRLEILNMPKNNGKRENEISFRSVNLEIVTILSFFSYCIEKGYIDKNPAAKIKKLNELSRLKTLSDEDIKKLIAGATNKLTKDLITFLIYTGCRKGEALNLKWDDVDLKNNVIAIKGTKTKYDRHIPIHNQLKELLSEIAKNKDCEYVFNNNGKKINNFIKSFMTACKNAGIKDFHIHDLRHVFASKMVMGGTSLYITGELLGHRTTQMTKRYSHLVPDTLRKAVNKVFG